MSIASTLLLLNNDPSKPLNEHFDDSLVDLKNWISNAIQYIATDDVIKEYSRPSRTNIDITIKHKGALKVKAGAVSISGTSIALNVNGKKVGSLTAGGSAIINIEANDVLTIQMSSSTFQPEYIRICGCPALLDF